VEGVDEGWVVDHPAHDTLENQSQRESREIMIREPTLSYPMRAKPRAVRMVVVNNSAGPDSMRNSEISANLSSQIVDQLPGTHSQPPSRMATMSYSATRAEESSVVDPHPPCHTARLSSITSTAELLKRCHRSPTASPPRQSVQPLGDHTQSRSIPPPGSTVWLHHPLLRQRARIPSSVPTSKPGISLPPTDRDDHSRCRRVRPSEWDRIQS